MGTGTGLGSGGEDIEEEEDVGTGTGFGSGGEDIEEEEDVEDDVDMESEEDMEPEGDMEDEEDMEDEGGDDEEDDADRDELLSQTFDYRSTAKFLDCESETIVSKPGVSDWGVPWEYLTVWGYD